MSRKPNLPRHGKKDLDRPGALPVLLVLILLAVPLGIYLYQHRPNLYDSTRTDLLQAERELDVYHHDMELLVEEDRHASDALKASIASLQKAAALDPEDAAEIDAIGSALQGWEQQAHSGTLSPADLHDKYRSLAEQVQRLVDKRTRAPQPEEPAAAPGEAPGQ